MEKRELSYTVEMYIGDDFMENRGSLKTKKESYHTIQQSHPDLYLEKTLIL